ALSGSGARCFVLSATRSLSATRLSATRRVEHQSYAAAFHGRWQPNAEDTAFGVPSVRGQRHVIQPLVERNPRGARSDTRRRRRLSRSYAKVEADHRHGARRTEHHELAAAVTATLLGPIA